MNYNFTFCNGCKHAIVENGVQTSCAINKLNKQTSTLEADGFYQSKNVCLFKNKDESEINLKFGYIFILKDVSKLDILKENISNVMLLNPIWIGISHDFPEKADYIISYLSDIKCSYNIVCNYNPIEDIYRLDQFVKNYKNGWTIVNLVGEELDLSLVNKLNNYLNLTKKPIALIKNNGINGECYYNFIYKFLGGSVPKINPETEEIINSTYEQRIQEKDSNMIMTWEEINEHSCNSTSI